MATIFEALMIAVQHHQAGRRQAAEQIYRQILRVDPMQPDAIHLLGVMAYEAGQHELAIEYIERAIRLKGTVSEFHNNLGNALQAQGKLDEAVACYHRALELRPDFAGAHNNLGNVFHDQRKLDEAVACYRRALELKPNYAEAHNNLGAALQGRGKLGEAVACFRRALESKLDYIEAYYNLGNAFKDGGDLDAAVACYHRALELKADFAEAHVNLSLVLRDQNKLDAAAACCRRALELKPNCAEAQLRLGEVYEEQGAFAEAQLAFRAALKLQPAFALPHAYLAKLLRGKLPDADRIALEERIAESQLNQDHKSQLSFALAHVLDARGECRRAADLLRQANALRLELNRGHRAYHPAEHEGFVDKLIRAFNHEFFARLAGAGIDTRRPVFIVGLPRSGATLVEQVLASHSQIYGAGELQLGSQSFEAVPAALGRSDQLIDCVPLLNSTALASLAEQHLDRLRQIDGGRAERIVDKMPDNYLFLGLLAALFPRGTFIHCRRDLRDVAISCWMNDFRKIYWTNDPGHIASRIRQYVRVMDHWRETFPILIHEVN